VPKGRFPKTIAAGDHDGMTIFDPVALVDIERYQKIAIHAQTPDTVYPPAAELAAARNAGFLRDCLRRITRVDFADPQSRLAYARAEHGALAVLDAAAFAAVLAEAPTRAVFAAIAPDLVATNEAPA
jgi:hypothetical protein